MVVGSQREDPGGHLSTPVFLNTLERTALSTWIRETESLFGYYFVLVIHNIGLALLVGACAVISFRLLGFAPQLPLRPMKRFFVFVWVGFWLNVISGIFLLIAYPTKAFTNPVFYIKLVLVGFGMWFLIRIDRYLGEATVQDRVSVARGRSLALWTLCLWLGVLTAGRVLAYTASYILFGKTT